MSMSDEVSVDAEKARKYLGNGKSSSLIMRLCRSLALAQVMTWAVFLQNRDGSQLTQGCSVQRTWRVGACGYLG